MNYKQRMIIELLDLTEKIVKLSNSNKKQEKKITC